MRGRPHKAIDRCRELAQRPGVGRSCPTYRKGTMIWLVVLVLLKAAVVAGCVVHPDECGCLLEALPAPTAPAPREPDVRLALPGL